MRCNDEYRGNGSFGGAQVEDRAKGAPYFPLRRSDGGKMLFERSGACLMGLFEEAYRGGQLERAGSFLADESQLPSHMRKRADRSCLSRWGLVSFLHAGGIGADHSGASNRRGARRTVQNLSGIQVLLLGSKSGIRPLRRLARSRSRREQAVAGPSSEPQSVLWRCPPQ